MAWVKLDDKFPEHPKVLKAGPVAAWLYVRAIAYSNRHLTDGFVSHAAVKAMSGESGAKRLADAGLWEAVEGGFRIHDYLKYQPSKAETEARRARMSELGRRGGRSKSERGESAPLSAPLSETLSVAATQPANPRSPVPKPAVSVTSSVDVDETDDDEHTITDLAVEAALAELRAIVTYPFDTERDRAHLGGFHARRPAVDLVAQLQRWVELGYDRGAGSPRRALIAFLEGADDSPAFEAVTRPQLCVCAHKATESGFSIHAVGGTGRCRVPDCLCERFTEQLELAVAR